MKKIVYGLAVFFLLGLAFQGCEQKGMSRGTIRNIVVVADSVLWDQVRDQIQAKLSPERFTPQPEYIFSLNQIPPQDLGRLKRYSQVLFIGTLDMQGPTKNLLDQMLPVGSQSRGLVEQGERFFYKVDEPWSKDQILGVLVANNLAELKNQISQQGQLIFDTFDLHADMRAKKQVYYREYQKEPTKELMDKFGWSVNVPLEYFIALEDSAEQFVWIRRMNPQRELFVHWEEVDDPSILHEDWMTENRNRLTNEFYSGDYIYSDSLVNVQYQTVNFQEKYAIQLEGVWQNDSLVAGGPFRSIGFYNESDSRLYLIDISVFAPEERKWSYLRQLEAVAKTFNTKQKKITRSN